MDRGLVSILMNCYNGEKYLAEALDSIKNQTYKNWELIFWDNQSTDSSKKIFQSYEDSRFKYYCAERHTDLGGGRAAAWRYLSGDFIAILDVDDLWLPSKLEKQLILFDDDEVGIAICDTIFFSENKERVLYNKSYPPSGMVFSDLVRRYFISLETVVVRKSTADFHKISFDSNYSHISDFDFLTRLSKHCKLAVYPEVLAKWRVHSNSSTWSEFDKFFYEEQSWFKKMLSHSDVNLVEIKLLFYYHKKSALRSAIYKISMGDNRGARKSISVIKGASFLKLIVLFISYMPFLSVIFKKIITYKRGAFFD